MLVEKQGERLTNDYSGIVDELDRRILQRMSSGINSYDDLSHECNVTRSTIYRRVALLEKRGLIRRITRTSVDYGRLNIVTLCFACRVNQAALKKTFAVLKDHERVKLLWRTYGYHNMVFIVFCEKGDEGVIIDEINSILEKFGAADINVSVGFKWEKMDFTPFTDELQQDKQQLKLYYSEDERITKRSIIKH